jgi:hypothetical protein
VNGEEGTDEMAPYRESRRTIEQSIEYGMNTCTWASRARAGGPARTGNDECACVSLNFLRLFGQHEQFDGTSDDEGCQNGRDRQKMKKKKETLSLVAVLK